MKPANPDSTFGSLKPTPPRREKYKRRAAIARRARLMAGTERRHFTIGERTQAGLPPDERYDRDNVIEHPGSPDYVLDLLPDGLTRRR